MRRPLCLLIAALTLTACTSGAPPTEAPLLLPPASLTQAPPEELPQPASPSLEDLTANHIETAGTYHRIKDQLKGLIEWVKTVGAPHELR